MLKKLFSQGCAHDRLVFSVRRDDFYQSTYFDQTHDEFITVFKNVQNNVRMGFKF